MAVFTDTEISPLSAISSSQQPCEVGMIAYFKGEAAGAQRRCYRKELRFPPRESECQSSPCPALPSDPSTTATVVLPPRNLSPVGFLI